MGVQYSYFGWTQRCISTKINTFVNQSIQKKARGEAKVTLKAIQRDRKRSHMTLKGNQQVSNLRDRVGRVPRFPAGSRTRRTEAHFDPREVMPLATITSIC